MSAGSINRVVLVLVLLSMTALYLWYVHKVRAEKEQNASLIVLAGEVPPMVKSLGGGVEEQYLADLLAVDALPSPELEIITFPFSRQWRYADAIPHVDMVLTVPEGYDLGWENTKPYVQYQNGVFYRRSSFPDGLGDRPLEALQGRRVIGFAGALQVIGALAEAEADFGLYLERKSQYRQALLLATGFADAIIAERIIAEYFFEELPDGVEFRRDDYAFEPVFCPTPYVIAVRDGADRARLDQAIEAMGAVPTASDLYHRYGERSAGSVLANELSSDAYDGEACIQ